MELGRRPVGSKSAKTLVAHEERREADQPRPVLLPAPARPLLRPRQAQAERDEDAAGYSIEPGHNACLAEVS